MASDGSSCLLPGGAVASLVHMLPFAGWWKSLAAAVMGLGPGKELQPGAVRGARAAAKPSGELRGRLSSWPYPAQDFVVFV